MVNRTTTMDPFSVASGGMSLKAASNRKSSSGGTIKNLWAAVRTGSVHDVEIALANLKKQNGNINEKNALGSTALHIAAWRNHLPVVRRLLAAGADPNAQVLVWTQTWFHVCSNNLVTDYRKAFA